MISSFCNISTFGELKTVRLPKKAAGSGNHRGFGFIDFITKQDAKVCVPYKVSDMFIKNYCFQYTKIFNNICCRYDLSIESICSTLPQHPSVRETPRAGMG